MQNSPLECIGQNEVVNCRRLAKQSGLSLNDIRQRPVHNIRVAFLTTCSFPLSKDDIMVEPRTRQSLFSLNTTEHGVGNSEQDTGMEILQARALGLPFSLSSSDESSTALAQQPRSTTSSLNASAQSFEQAFGRKSLLHAEIVAFRSLVAFRER